MSHDHPAAQEDPRSFKNEFMQILHTLALPMFHEFVSDAQGNTFPSDHHEGMDDAGNPYATVRFILDRTATLDANPANECVFTIKGLLKEEKIDLRAAYDQRPGKEAAYHEKLEIQMVNQIGLEDQLTDFLSAAMAARRDQAIPPRKRDSRHSPSCRPLQQNLPKPSPFPSFGKSARSNHRQKYPAAIPFNKQLKSTPFPRNRGWRTLRGIHADLNQKRRSHTSRPGRARDTRPANRAPGLTTVFGKYFHQ